jgi:hypothetical protein
MLNFELQYINVWTEGNNLPPSPPPPTHTPLLAKFKKNLITPIIAKIKQRKQLV